MQPTIRIIDNKKLLLTSSEWDMYQAVCRSYDRANFKGEELFKNLFESDDDGVITFIKPPSSRYTSMEVFFFICAVFQHQHMRKMYDQIQSLMNEVRAKSKEIESTGKK